MGSFQVEDASSWSETELGRERLITEAHSPFDLENGPILRALLFKKALVNPAEIMVISSRSRPNTSYLSMDHIVTDFWSMTVLAREVLASYEANKAGKTLAMPQPPARYSDYVRWQEQMLAGPRAKHIGTIGGIILALNFLL